MCRKLALCAWLILNVRASVHLSHMYGTARDQCEIGAAMTQPRISCSLGHCHSFLMMCVCVCRQERCVLLARRLGRYKPFAVNESGRSGE